MGLGGGGVHLQRHEVKEEVGGLMDTGDRGEKRKVEDFSTLYSLDHGPTAAATPSHGPTTPPRSLPEHTGKPSSASADPSPSLQFYVNEPASEWRGEAESPDVCESKAREKKIMFPRPPCLKEQRPMFTSAGLKLFFQPLNTTHALYKPNQKKECLLTKKTSHRIQSS